MKRLFLLLYFIFYLFHSTFAQEPCGLRISLLTCSPGEELYSTFGHTALRVQDPATGTDEIYNYGTFEFAPDFYGKFIRGKLLYSLSVESFPDFLYSYQMESRSIVEQELQLNCAEKQKLYAALQINALPENRQYRYDFLFDNCTTRARDIVARNTQSPVVFNNILPKEIPTFRNLIHSYLNAGNEYWSKLGIDILLGAKLDKKVTNMQAMFLPDYLLKGFDSALVNNQPLVTPARSILKMPSPLAGRSLFTPLAVFSVLFLVVMALSFFSPRWAVVTLLIFDFLFFFVLGLAGLLLLFMWFGTDHKVCANNYNLLWALPFHIITAFFIYSHRLWISRYFQAVFWLSLILAVTWFVLPQQMNNALLPLVLLIIVRSWRLSKSKDHAAKANPS